MGAPSAFEQFALELVNRFRTDPQGVFGRIVKNIRTGDARNADTEHALDYFDVDLRKLRKELSQIEPSAPLAWSDDLGAAAERHSRAMKTADMQAHVLPGEAGIGERLAAAGYEWRAYAENVYAFAESAKHAHDGFVVDWGTDADPGLSRSERTDGMQAGRGHRSSMSSDKFSEIGIGAVKDVKASTDVGKWLVTHDLGVRDDAEPFLLGVAYADRDGDGFYSIGEGRGGLTVAAAGRGSDKAARSGGYALEVGEGEATVTLSGAAVKGRIKAAVMVGNENAKLDVVDGGRLLTTVDLDVLKGRPTSVTAIGHDDVTLGGGPKRDRLTGNDADNVLRGEGGGDALVGGRGDDSLFGDAGRDRLEGGGGADALNGGPGADRLFGGRGPDRFVFGEDAGHDRIMDWRSGDVIDLRPLASPSLDPEITEAGANAVVSFLDSSITVVGAAGEISAADLLLS